jgi:dephospho-CoA kinase
MNDKTDWEPIIRKMERLLRLRSFPVAFKMLESKRDLEGIPFLRRPSHGMTLCQMINLVRNFDWTVGADDDDFALPSCPAMLGLRDKPAIYKDGTFRSIVWVKSREDGKRYEEAIPHLPLDRYGAVVMAPLVYNPFEPDIVLVYANPAQMILLVNALQFEDYEVMEFFCVGETSCSDAVARCYLNDKPALTIPCYGERRYGHAQDDELVMALPARHVEKAVRGLDALYRRGVRYPISYAGVESDVLSLLPPAYTRLEYTAKEIRGEDKDNRLLLGVTGGIASGKSTVSAMLEELGSPIVDFDQLAREVVEPGEPAYDRIVDYFGSQVVAEDGTLDRKALSDIVFKDMEKRKKLESFTHPAIFERFAERVNGIAARDPNAVIQVAVPLLLELNLQYMFHKILVVHIPAEEQVRRLAERDGISSEEAENILKAQLPIEEKTGYADYVIDNRGPLEETRRQVEALWKRIQDIQREGDETR